MSERRLPIPYKYTILIGFCVGLLFALKTYLMYLYWGEYEYFVFKRHGLIPIVNYTTWGLLMPVAYYFISRFQVGKGHGPRDTLLALLASLLMSLIHEFFSNFVYYFPMHILGFQPFNEKAVDHIFSALPSALISRLIEYWILYAVVSGLEFQKKYQDKQLELAQVESKLSDAQLNALRLQLQPHFLFNTLNTISSLMEISVKDAQKIVSQLGNLLRTVLDKNKRNTVTLRDELAFIQSYLAIEQVRFQDRMIIRYDIGEKALHCLVPSLILQPLVENAVKHGFAQQSRECTIEVKASLSGERLHLAVRDDGRGSDLPFPQLLKKGNGLSNIHDRLELLYKDEYDMAVHTRPHRGFEVEITLPCQGPRDGFSEVP